MLKGYKYRIYPNKQQEEQIQKTFGCCRFVYNQCLNRKIEKYKNESISMSKIDLNNYCNQVLKKEYEWLKEVDKWSLTNSIYNMDSAYQKFFKEHAGYPKFKSKKNNHYSYTTYQTLIKISDRYIKLPKIGLVRIKKHRDFEGIIKSVTVSKTPGGKYYVSVLVHCKE